MVDTYFVEIQMASQTQEATYKKINEETISFLQTNMLLLLLKSQPFEKFTALNYEALK